MAERSRRDKKSKADKLAEYRLARAGGSRSWKVRLNLIVPMSRILTALQEEEADIYDEVTEDQYKSIVRGRLQQDDFVVDDGVGGYMDDGHDDWSGGGNKEPDSDVEDYEKRKKREDRPIALIDASDRRYSQKEG